MGTFFFLALFVVGANCFYINNGTDSKDKIVGGEFVDIKTVPYLAQLLQDGSHICGATIISPYWLISAAHCFDKTSNFVIITGSSDRAIGVKRTIAKIIVHRHYDSDNFDNDISLIKVKYPINFNELQQPIKISKVPPKAGQKVKFSGFGDEATDQESFPRVKAGHSYIVDHDECVKALDENDVTDNMFCTDSSKVDTCQGDSGGPVIHNGRLVGVVSWGIGCGEGYPGVQTQVANYLDWIQAKSGLKL